MVGGKVVLSEGTLNLAAQVLLDSQDDITLEGSGWGSVLFQTASTDLTTALLATGSGKSRIRIANLTVDGNRANNAGTAHNIKLLSASSLLSLENVRSINAKVDGIHVIDATDVLIQGCYVDTPGERGIDITSADVARVRVIGCHVKDTTNGGIEIDDGATDILLQGNLLDGCSLTTAREAITVHNHAGVVSPTQITIVGNVIARCPSGGIYIVDIGGTDAPRHIVVANNVLNATDATGRDGILVRDGDYVVISGNEINLFTDGVRVDEGSTYVSVIGNVVRNAGFAGIEIDNSSRIIVLGNVVLDDGGGPSALDYGILEDNGADNNLIADNVVNGANTAEISTVGAATIVRDNHGFVTENSGTATLVNGQTSIVVTHGLDVTPVAGDIMVTPMESLGAASEYYIDTYTATQFTIHVDVDPTQDVDFAWKAVVL